MESYIAYKKKLYTSILEFLESSEDNDKPKIQCFERLTQIMKQQYKDGDIEWMQEFLRIIKNVNDSHHRYPNFVRNIQELLQHYKDEIKQTMPNDDLFQLFQDDKLMIHFLLKNGIIIIISDKIYDQLVNIFECNLPSPLFICRT